MRRALYLEKQHCLAVCIGKGVDGVSVAPRFVKATFIPHIGIFVEALDYIATITGDVRGLTRRQWLDGASRTPSSHTYKIEEKLFLHQYLTKIMVVKHGLSTDKQPIDRGLVDGVCEFLHVLS